MGNLDVNGSMRIQVDLKQIEQEDMNWIHMTENSAYLSCKYRN